MKAMVLNKVYSIRENNTPLKLRTLPDPKPNKSEILVKVTACSVCHTELDEIEGRTAPSQFPIVLGHQVVGVVEKKGINANKFSIGDRVGIAWIYYACGKCSFCFEGNENLCKDFIATGRDVNGGYAQYITVLENFAYFIPNEFSDLEAAPLLCAGAIGYRSLKLSGIKNGDNLGLTGFGASAHIVTKMVRYKYPQSKIFVFARSKTERDFAKELGAVWVGVAEETPPEGLDCIIDTTPAWKPIVEALKNLKSGGRLVINAIRKENVDKEYLYKIDYATHLWLEKEIKSVANVSRSDVENFLKIASMISIKPEVQEFALEDANKALLELKNRKIRGAKVLRID